MIPGCSRSFSNLNYKIDNLSVKFDDKSQIDLTIGGLKVRITGNNVEALGRWFERDAWALRDSSGN